MIYSVWNQKAGFYDYYQSGGGQETANAPKPTHLKDTKLGLTPPQASWPLPMGAQKVGSGEFARGHVSSRAGSGGALSGWGVEDLFSFNGLALAAAVFFAFKWISKR